MNELRAAYVDLCRGIDVQYFVTLASNQDGTIPGMRKRARDFCARMDRKLLGPSWSKRPAGQRTDGVFFIEHVASNIHLHGLLRFPSGAEDGLRMTSALIWNKICPSGTIDFQSIYDLPRGVTYCMKELLLPGYSDEQFFLLRELMSERAHQTI